MASEAWIPGIWRIEVANVLQMGIRRKRHTVQVRDIFLNQLQVFPIRVDLETHERAWGPTAQLAARHGLTVYDASYLELAMRRKLPIATLDRELQAAAIVEDVELLCE